MRKMIITIIKENDSSSFSFKGDDLPLEFVSWAVSHLRDRFDKNQSLVDSIKNVIK